MLFLIKCNDELQHMNVQIQSSYIIYIENFYFCFVFFLNLRNILNADILFMTEYLYRVVSKY